MENDPKKSLCSLGASKLKLKFFFSKKTIPGKSLFLGLVIFLVIFYPQFSYAGAVNPFIDTFLTYYNTTIDTGDISKFAKYDILDVNRFNYADVNGATWSAIKAINPDIEIYLYQLGAETNIDQEAYETRFLSSIARITNSRGHLMGALDTNHPELFLLDGSEERIYNPAYPHSVLMDFGSPTYQVYWSEATATDIVGQFWEADGVFVDNCAVDAGATENPLGGAYPVTYPEYTTWNIGMNSFTNSITAGLHSHGQKIFANRGHSRFAGGAAAWIALDASANPPDLVMEEGAFVVQYGTGDAQFYPETDWKRQVDTVQQMTHSKVAFMSHADLSSESPNGTDNYGKPVTFWQALWYAMCSYHLARKDAPNNAYLMFTTSLYKAIPWYDEYDRINLGAATSNYTVAAVGGVNVYRREFARGYIFVNPTDSDASAVALPVPCRQLTHANINDDSLGLPLVDTVDIPAHNGVVMLKDAATIPPAEPSGLNVD